MSDNLLERVRVAKERATHEFLKESISFQLSMLVMEGFHTFENAIKRKLGIPASESISDLNNQMSLLIKDTFSDPNSTTSKEIVESIKSYHGERLLKSFLDLQDHFNKAENVVSANISGADSVSLARRKAVAAHLEGMYTNAVERGIQMYDTFMEEEGNGIDQPEVLVLQGGGAKGMAYSGVVEHLEDKGILKGIKMVAGTSAGSLMGLPVALGYSAEEINKIVHEGRFAQFFAESTLKFKFLAKIATIFGKKEPKEIPFSEAGLLGTFARKNLIPALLEVSNKDAKYWKNLSEGELQYNLKALEADGSLDVAYRHAMAEFEYDLKLKGRENEIGILKFSGLPGRSEAMQSALNCVRLVSPSSQKRETIEEFIADIIQIKLEQVPRAILEEIVPAITTVDQMRSVNFSQLKQISEMYPNGGFKEFGVAVTDSYVPLTLQNAVRGITRLVKTEYQKITGDIEPDDGVGTYDKNRLFRPIFVRADDGSGRYMDMPIKKAVRASMNLPIVFRAIRHLGTRLFDGGMTNNFPHRMFYDRFANKAEAKRKTIGFMLSAIENDIEMKALDDMINSQREYLSIKISKDPAQKWKGVTTFLRHPLSETWRFIGDRVSRFLNQRIVNIMSTYNSTMPSIDEMDNVGVISTGSVNTADFHLSRPERIRLHFAGSLSSIAVTSGFADKYLRFATSRLVSLMNMEAQLTSNGRVLRADPSEVSKAITGEIEGGWHLGDVLLGRLGTLKKQQTTVDNNYSA